MSIDETGVVVYCPYCDKPYEGGSKKSAEKKAGRHVRGQHPEMENPFDSNED